MEHFKSLAEQFFKIDRWMGAAPVGAGNINDTYRLDFEQNGVALAFILQRINHQIFRQPEALMHNICLVTKHLHTGSFPYESPAPVQAIDGRFFHQDATGNYWRCFPFIPDSYAPEGKTDAATALEATVQRGRHLRKGGKAPQHGNVDTLAAKEAAHLRVRDEGFTAPGDVASQLIVATDKPEEHRAQHNAHFPITRGSVGRGDNRGLFHNLQS